ADSGEIAGGDAGGGERGRHHGGDRLPNLVGVMLYPAGPRIMLRQLARRGAERTARSVVNHRPRTGGALIDGEQTGGSHAVVSWERGMRDSRFSIFDLRLPIVHQQPFVTRHSAIANQKSKIENGQKSSRP